MRIHQRATADYILRPPVIATLVWVTLWSIWYIWTIATSRFPTVEEGGGLQLLSTLRYSGATLGNLLILTWLAIEWRRTQDTQPGFRKARTLGLLGSGVGAILLQVALHMAHQTVYA